jgi:hypothetical protein
LDGPRGEAGAGREGLGLVDAAAVVALEGPETDLDADVAADGVADGTLSAAAEAEAEAGPQVVVKGSALDDDDEEEEGGCGGNDTAGDGDGGDDGSGGGVACLASPAPVPPRPAAPPYSSPARFSTTLSAASATVSGAPPPRSAAEAEARARAYHARWPTARRAGGHLDGASDVLRDLHAAGSYVGADKHAHAPDTDAARFCSPGQQAVSVDADAGTSRVVGTALPLHRAPGARTLGRPLTRPRLRGDPQPSPHGPHDPCDARPLRLVTVLLGGNAIGEYGCKVRALSNPHLAPYLAPSLAPI